MDTDSLNRQFSGELHGEPPLRQDKESRPEKSESENREEEARVNGETSAVLVTKEGTGFPSLQRSLSVVRKKQQYPSFKSHRDQFRKCHCLLCIFVFLLLSKTMALVHSL